MVAYAVRMSRTNQHAIASENPKFDKEVFDAWLADYLTGYFIRDPDSQFDCQYLHDVVFHSWYEFENNDDSEMFRRIRPT